MWNSELESEDMEKDFLSFHTRYSSLCLRVEELTAIAGESVAVAAAAAEILLLVDHIQGFLLELVISSLGCIPESLKFIAQF
jgi:hypothetical protein